MALCGGKWIIVNTMCLSVSSLWPRSDNTHNLTLPQEDRRGTLMRWCHDDKTRPNLTSWCLMSWYHSSYSQHNYCGQSGTICIPSPGHGDIGPLLPAAAAPYFPMTGSLRIANLISESDWFELAISGSLLAPGLPPGIRLLLRPGRRQGKT